MNLIISFIILSLLGCNDKTSSVVKAPDAADLVSRVVAGNLNHPWEITWGQDNMIWFTERGGTVKRLNPATGTITNLLTISDVASQGEGGLLGMALHPEFTTSTYIYLAYNFNSPGAYQEKVVRYTYDGSSLINPLILATGISASGIHNGCRLMIVNDKLFITTGDAADPSRSQNTSRLNGKVLRINLDGSIPTDNPIAGNRVWSWGHRNAQGIIFANNMIYSSEHGPDTDDEINIIEKGRNYGWPDVKGICNTGSENAYCSANNIKEPIKAWTPTVAVCGMDYYNLGLIPQFKNCLLVTTLRGSRLIALKLNDTKTAVIESKDYFVNEYGRLRDICVAPDGKVYISSSNGGGGDKIVEISKR